MNGGWRETEARFLACSLGRAAAGHSRGGLVFRRIWTPPRGRDGRNTPLPRVGTMSIDAGTVARIIQARAASAGFDPTTFGGHSLKRGALSTGMDRGVHPTRLKQLGRHKTYAVLDVHLDLGEPSEGHTRRRAVTARPTSGP